VSDAREIRNLALVGFMGAGKSTTGRLVAGVLRFDFVDTDDLIEQKAGKRIPEIFAQAGETGFRAIEAEVVNGLGQLANTVIATGGGLIVNPANLASLQRHALVVCLWASTKTIWERVRNQSHRPLLQDSDPQGKIERLLAERKPFYREADVLVSTELRSQREVAMQVAHQFRLARAAR
jgi:shikimate kinase